jgi:hypothetical protein
VLGVVSVFSLTFDILFGVLGMALLLAAILLGAGAISDRSRQQQGPPEGR